jgi:4-methyl-5(b-hydroxyethyl)-thiazole monophosphate biosynthesis
MDKAYILLAEGFEEIEALTPADVLRRADLEVFLVSASDSLEVKGAHQIIVKADKLLAKTDVSDASIIILPGGMPGTNNLNNNSLVKQVVFNHAVNGKTTAAICAAPIILGDMNLLEGQQATCYPGYETRLRGAVYLNEQVVVSNHYITANGAGAAMAFSLKLVEILKSADLAKDLAKKMMSLNI